MLELLRHEKILVGIKQVTRSLEEGYALKSIYLASDAEIHLQEKIQELAKGKNVDVIAVESRQKLGKVCGIDVGATVVAVQE